MDTMLSVKVVPKASKTESAGVMADVTLNQVEIVAGHASTRKTVRLRGH